MQQSLSASSVIDVVDDYVSDANFFNANPCQSRPTECFRSLLTEQIYLHCQKMPVKPESCGDMLFLTNHKTGAVCKG